MGKQKFFFTDLFIYLVGGAQRERETPSRLPAKCGSVDPHAWLDAMTLKSQTIAETKSGTLNQLCHRGASRTKILKTGILSTENQSMIL